MGNPDRREVEPLFEGVICCARETGKSGALSPGEDELTYGANELAFRLMI